MVLNNVYVNLCSKFGNKVHFNLFKLSIKYLYYEKKN